MVIVSGASEPTINNVVYLQSGWWKCKQTSAGLPLQRCDRLQWQTLQRSVAEKRSPVSTQQSDSVWPNRRAGCRRHARGSSDGSNQYRSNLKSRGGTTLSGNKTLQWRPGQQFKMETRHPCGWIMVRHTFQCSFWREIVFMLPVLTVCF